MTCADAELALRGRGPPPVPRRISLVPARAPPPARSRPGQPDKATAPARKSRLVTEPLSASGGLACDGSLPNATARVADEGCRGDLIADGCWVQGSGCWVRSGFWVLGSGCWVRSAGFGGTRSACWVRGAARWRVRLASGIGSEMHASAGAIGIFPGTRRRSDRRRARALVRPPIGRQHRHEPTHGRPTYPSAAASRDGRLRHGQDRVGRSGESLSAQVAGRRSKSF